MKNIPRYRIGNDLTVFWAIHNRDGSPYDLKDKEIHLYVTNERGREEVKATLSDLPDGSQNNVIRWDYRGETQRVLGLYTLTVEIQSSEEHREITRDYCEAFTLVSRSDMENEEEEANISVGGDLILSSKLDIYRFEAVDVDVSEIKIKIDQIQGAITKLETEINLKASVESVEGLEEYLTQIRKSIADLTLSVNDLEAEIELKASVESVNILKDSIGSIKNSVAELSVRADEITAEIELKASREEITLLGNSIQKVDKAVAQQIIKVEGLEASIENLVSKETFDAVTGELDEAYTSVKATVDGVITTIKDQSGEIASIKESVSGVSVSLGTVKNDVDALRNQVDGVTESYFYPYSPTLSNEPAASWIREGKEAEHKGDTFTNTSEDGEGAGRSWRWLQSENGEWGWKAISDTDAIKALQMAAKAQETADGKCTTFYTQPANYSFGDLWFVHNGNYPPYKKGEILSATQDSDYFDLSHWEPKTSYTEAINELDNTMKTSFRDGVLDDAERNTIAENLKNLSKEQSALDSRYNTLIINADFADGELKEEYRSIKREYDSAYNSLVSVVERILLASTEDLASLFEEYETKSEAYESALSEYNSCEERVREALMGSMNYAHVYLDNIAKDGVITPVEKEQLFEIYRNIAREYDTTVGNAYNYKIWKYAEGGESETIGNNGQDGRYEAYLRYKAAYAPILSAFTSPLWGFDKMSETTKLEDSLTVSRLKGYFEDYYSAHGELWNIFSAITASIEEAQKKAEETLKKLTDCLTPEEMTTLIGRGVVLSTIIATKDADGKITAGMNATNLFVHSEHGRVVIAGGVKDIEDWNTASGRIYEDGHFVINSGEISDEVRIGNATLKNVIQATSQFDVVAVPYKDKNGETAFLPLFTVNRNSDGEVVSVSSVYDFVGNKNIWAAEEISANGLNLGGGGSGSGGSTTLDGLIDVNLSSPQNGNILVFNGTHWVNKPQSELVPEVDLSDYYTKQQTQNAITSALSPYIKATDADGKYAALASFNALQSSFDRLYSALNDDTSGVINTWNEVVDFVNEYSGSEDLSTILGKMNTDINARVKVSDFDTWKTDVFNPLSVTVTNLGKKVNDHTDKINKILSWFELREDEDLLITTHNLASYKEISSNGISQGTGGGGSGLISSVLSATSLGATLANDNSVVFNAYATNEIYKVTQGHASRIGVLESQVGQLTTQGTKVSVSDLLTTGTKIATITVDGVAHEVKGDFLPTNGGTISNSGYNFVEIKRTDTGAGYSAIKYSNVGGVLGYIGIGGSGSNYPFQPTFYDKVNSHCLIHSGNYANQIGDYYLKTSGGVIAGTLMNPLTIKTSAAIEVGIPMSVKDSVKMWVGWNSSNGAYIYNSAKNYYLGIKDDGTPHYNGNTLLHSGNVGDYAVRAIGAASVDSARNAAGYDNSGQGTLDLPAVGGFISVGHSNGKYGFQILGDPYSQGLHYRGLYGGELRPWKTIAFIDSNVASATKLATASGILEDFTVYKAPTVYGIKLVNGDSSSRFGFYSYETGKYASIVNTKNDIENCGLQLNDNGNVYVFGKNVGIGTNAPQYKLDINGSTRITNNVIIGDSSTPNGRLKIVGENILASTPALYISNSAGDGLLDVRNNGNVGIGTANPAYKLDVNGDANIEGVLSTYFKFAFRRESENVISVPSIGSLSFMVGDNKSIVLNPSGNVTIGGSDLAGTDYRLRVQGGTRLDYNATLAGSFTILNYQDNSYYGIIESGATGLSVVSIREGVGYTPILLNPNGGNVLIGTTTDNGEKLQVNGDIRIKPQYGSLVFEHVAYFKSYGNKRFLIHNENGLFLGLETTEQDTLIYGKNIKLNAATTISNTLSVGGNTTINGIAYFGGTTYYINTSGNANFNAISGSSLQVDSAVFNGTIHSNEYSGSVAKWSITKDGAASFASLSNGGLLETSTLRVSSTSTFTGKTNHNGGIGAAWVSISGTLEVGTTSTFTGKTTHNGGIKATDIETRDFLATGDAKIYGELRLQKESNANGNYLYFGDGSFCYLHEENDDRLTIYAQKGLVTKAATGTAWDSITKENWIDDNSAHTRFVNNYNALAIIIDKDYGASYRRAAIQVGDTSNNVGTLYLNPKGGEVHIASSGVDTYVKSSLHVGSILYASTIYAGSTLYLQANTITNQAEWWTLSATGDFYTLGNIAAEGEISANALNQGSDIRFKHQLGDITLDLDTIANAPMFRFTWTNKENSRVQIGTSAQYWKDSARELVSVDKDDFHRLDYATLGVLIGVTLGKMVKNHEDRIKELEREVVELKEENRRLRYEC